MENQTPASITVRAFSELPQYYRHVRQEIVSVVPTEALNILDVGCGAGVLGKALKAQNSQRRIVGIELNEEAFYHAQTNLDIAYKVDLESFKPPFNPGEFDCIIFADILEHLKDPWNIACQYAKFLKPSGTLIASIPNIRHLPTLQQVVEQGTWKYEDEGILDRTHLRFFTKNDFIELLNNANVICDSVFYLGGQQLSSIRPLEPERIVRLGNVSLKNVSDEEFLELSAYQLLFVGKYYPQSSSSSNTTSDPLLINKTQTPQVTSLSIVVPWWDHTELLDIWKRNLKILGDTEIIFIDNGSKPQAQKELQEFCQEHNIKLIRNSENRGFAAANNQGVSVATTDYILHLNNDVELLAFPQKYLCDLAGYGIAGPGFLKSELNNLYIEGWGLCIKKSTLEALGGWCEDYGPGYWDDVDLCHRARLAGYPLTPIPDIHKWMRHKANTTGRDGRINQIALHIRNRGIFIQNHYSDCSPKIIIDGVFFQLYQTGIARVWESLLEEFVNSFAQHIVVLDRSGTAPKIDGIRYRETLAYSYANTDEDREMLQQICDEENADLFISTYYTTPLTTPSVFMAYDMIPEVLGWDLRIPMWQEKHRAIEHASAYIAISENTANDVVKVFPDISRQAVTVAHCGVKSTFTPARLDKISAFKNKYGINKPYFLLVGAGDGYKNSILFFQAFDQLIAHQGFDIVCTGSGGVLAPEFRAYTSGSTVHMLQLDDEELAIAYSGAIAQVYPSLYEGFGLPVLEAMASGCPVITCANASIPEVAGEAAIYVKDDHVEELVNALCEIQKPSVRKVLITAGLEQAKKFSWSQMADVVKGALLDATLVRFNLNEINLIIFPDWLQPEEELSLNLAQLIRTLATHPHNQDITLLIYTGNVDTQDAELLLSGVTMYLLMEEDLDVNEGLEISLIGQLAVRQWESLLSRINYRIVLEPENKQAIAQAQAENIDCCELEEIENKLNSFFLTSEKRCFNLEGGQKQ